MNKRKTVLYIGVFSSVLFSYLSFRKIDYYVLLNNLNEISIGPVFISLLFLLLSYFLRAIRWKNILVDSNLKFANLYSASMIGNMGNNILPFRIGELIRCYILGYQENISKSRILASVMFGHFPAAFPYFATADSDLLFIWFLCIWFLFPSFFHYDIDTVVEPLACTVIVPNSPVALTPFPEGAYNVCHSAPSYT